MESTDIGIEIEQEWKPISRLLAKGDESSNAMAVIEAQKVFCLVLDEVSYGSTIDDKILNAAGLFEDVKKILMAQEIYGCVVFELGYRLKSQDAKLACNAWLAGLMDLVGRDFEPRGRLARMANTLNFFWGQHPKFLFNLVLGILVFVAGVWFFTEMAFGRWLSAVGTGFAKFILEHPVVMGGLVVVLTISWLLGRKFRARHNRD